MKKLIFMISFSPLVSAAQSIQPRFENDTLYTSGGYKIYKGQTLYIGTGTLESGYFRYIKFHQSLGKSTTYTLQNSSIQVDKLKAFKYGGADNSSIRIQGRVTYKDGVKEETDIIINFERASESIAGSPGELIVPEPLKSKRTDPVIKETVKEKTTEAPKKTAEPDETRKQSVADEIKKLFDLYKAGALTKEEYEAQKKKLLEKQ